MLLIDSHKYLDLVSFVLNRLIEVSLNLFEFESVVIVHKLCDDSFLWAIEGIQRNPLESERLQLDIFRMLTSLLRLTGGFLSCSSE